MAGNKSNTHIYSTVFLLILRVLDLSDDCEAYLHIVRFAAHLLARRCRRGRAYRACYAGESLIDSLTVGTARIAALYTVQPRVNTSVQSIT